MEHDTFLMKCDMEEIKEELREIRWRIFLNRILLTIIISLLGFIFAMLVK